MTTPIEAWRSLSAEERGALIDTLRDGERDAYIEAIGGWPWAASRGRAKQRALILRAAIAVLEEAGT